MRSARFTVVPLWMVAAAFVLPAIRVCDDPVSPAGFASSGVFDFFWAAPPYLCAAVLAVLSLVVLRQRVVSLQARRVALATVGVLAATGLATSALMVLEKTVDWPFIAVSLPAAAIAAFLIRRARGQEPWAIWQHLVAAFAVLAAASGPCVMLTLEGIKRPSGLYIGAWLFLAGLAALLVMAGMTLAKSRR